MVTKIDMLPQPVAISSKNHRALMDANNRMKAVEQSMQMFQQQCEQRIAAIQAEVRNAWGEIAKETGVDMHNIIWEPHPTEFRIMPAQVRLKQG
jgi:hypothetical protein